jgi:hypothetical protein
LEHLQLLLGLLNQFVYGVNSKDEDAREFETAKASQKPAGTGGRP